MSGTQIRFVLGLAVGALGFAACIPSTPVHRKSAKYYADPATAANSTTPSTSATTLPAAAFTFAPATPLTNQSVQFKDTSTGNPFNWYWDFGDGLKSEFRDPVHMFAVAGTFRVMLTVVNLAGANTVIREVVVSLPPAPAPTAAFSYAPTAPVAGYPVRFADLSTGFPTAWSWTFGDGTTAGTIRSPTHVYAAPGTFTVTLTATNTHGHTTAQKTLTIGNAPTTPTFPLVDTRQTVFYGNTIPLAAAPVLTSDPFFGQDAQFTGTQPAYHDNGDGTITDLNTGLMWVLARGAKVTWDAAMAGAVTCTTGSHHDWRMPTAKELASLMDYTGKSGPTGALSAPFINSTYFQIIYGDATGGRVTDARDWSATPYASTTMMGDPTIFTVNFTDGRIEGYPKFVPGAPPGTGSTTYVRYVRGSPLYGENHFVDNGDGTITDTATGLMWAQGDSGTGMNWQSALAWVQAQNSANHLGHADWRMPNAKELQSIVDYSRSPATSHSAAIAPMFYATPISDEAGHPDFPFYWTGTTNLENLTPPPSPVFGAVTVAFGRALGWMKPPAGSTYTLLDVHGAGAVRSNPKSGAPADYPSLGVDAQGNPVYGLGPQGDVIRINNFVRLVRAAN